MAVNKTIFCLFKVIGGKISWINLRQIWPLHFTYHLLWESKTNEEIKKLAWTLWTTQSKMVFKIKIRLKEAQIWIYWKFPKINQFLREILRAWTLMILKLPKSRLFCRNKMAATLKIMVKMGKKRTYREIIASKIIPKLLTTLIVSKILSKSSKGTKKVFQKTYLEGLGPIKATKSGKKHRHKKI